jgi:hypothetical protein
MLAVVLPTVLAFAWSAGLRAECGVPRAAGVQMSAVHEVARYRAEVGSLLEALMDASDEPDVARALLKEATPMLLYPHRTQASRPRAGVRCMLAVQSARLDQTVASYGGERGEQATVALRQMKEHVLHELGI